MKRTVFWLTLVVLFCSVSTVVWAAGTRVAVFPVQQLGASRNGVNLQLTRDLTDRLALIGNDVVEPDAVISFMVNHRIRSAGYLDSINVARLRRDLGAAFVLLGTVCELQSSPEPRIGVILNLVRTSDGRIVWSYIDGRSRSDERNLLAVAEPGTTEALQRMVVNDFLRRWPWRIVNREQRVGALDIDAVMLRPQHVRPGGKIYCRVQVENTWGSGRPPRVFFKAAEQIYPATVGEDGVTFEGQWVAAEEESRVPVSLILDWPAYGRTESALLGNYLIDGTLPLFTFDLIGAKEVDGRLVFDKQVSIVPRMLVHKQLDRWELSFYFEGDERPIGSMDGQGNLPGGFIWRGMPGMENRGDGLYGIKLEVWDKAGNRSEYRKDVEMRRDPPKAEVAMSHSENEVVADLDYQGKIPLSYWRLEMWTEEGKILTQAEGQEMPATVDVKLPEAAAGRTIQGVLYTRNSLGKEHRQKVSHFLPDLEAQEQQKQQEESKEKSWVDEF